MPGIPLFFSAISKPSHSSYRKGIPMPGILVVGIPNPASLPFSAIPNPGHSTCRKGIPMPGILAAAIFNPAFLLFSVIPNPGHSPCSKGIPMPGTGVHYNLQPSTLQPSTLPVFQFSNIRSSIAFLQRRLDFAKHEIIALTRPGLAQRFSGRLTADSAEHPGCMPAHQGLRITQDGFF